MIAIGSDHGGYELRQEIMKHLEKRGLEYKDFGCDTPASTDYPIYGKKVAEAVASGECEKGILICGTGIGISMAANKVNGVRAAVCSEPTSARLTREHNNANILAIGARIVGDELAKDIVRTFLTTEYSNGERHERRLALLHEIEKRQ